MNNLTATLLANHEQLSAEEWTKQGRAVEFNSGSNQRIVSTSIPAVEIQITYKNLNFSQFFDLKLEYEQNHANTFIVDASEIHDSRPDVMGLNSSVWVFKEFKFNVVAPKVYNGTITIVSSVFFNNPEYQQQFSQSSSYTPTVSSDESFENLLNAVTPYQVDYEYMSNSIFSNIGRSARHVKDKGGLRKKWTLSWLIQESQFLQLLQYYRKKSGIMGTFGIPEEGSTGISLETYLGNADDYVANGYFLALDENLTKCMFMGDSFKYSKRVDNMYVCSSDIIEVLN
jgi:hypothetical protein